MAILRTEVKDYGGVDVWDSRDPSGPVYLAPHLLPACYAGGALTVAGQVLLDSAILQRIGDRDNALPAE